MKYTKYQQLVIIGSYRAEKYLTKKYLTTASDLLGFRHLATHTDSIKKKDNELD